MLYGGWDKGKGTSANYPFLASDYIPVKIDGKCGYYDTSGNEVIPCGTFEDVRPVHNHLAWVKKDGKWGVIELKELENQTITAVEKSESELHDLVEEKGTICAWEYADYDGDGKKEAFAIIGTNNMSDLKRKCEQYEQYNKLQNPPFISRGIFLIKRFSL